MWRLTGRNENTSLELSRSQNEPVVRALLDVQRRVHPGVLFLSETHLDRYPTECLRNRLKKDQKNGLY